MPNDDALRFLERLLETPSPSGFEERNAAHFRDYVAPIADQVRTDRLGNVIAAVNPEGRPRVMLSGHIDELGMLIHYIDEEGFCYFLPIGGHDPVNLVGQRVTIHTAQGPVPGVIGRKPIHLLDAEERGKAVRPQDLWIDIGVVGGRDETVAAGVRIGDPATFCVGMTYLQGDRIAARALDNRIGAWVVAEALRRVAGQHSQAAVFAVASVQEEIGLRGARASAFGIDPEIGIAVDVTFATDFPEMEKRAISEVLLGKGPAVLRGANASRRLADRIIAVAEENGIAYQVEAEAGGTGTDANAIQVSRAGVTTGLIEVPLRYMHTPCEVISFGDADRAAELLARVCLALAADDDWTP